MRCRKADLRRENGRAYLTKNVINEPRRKIQLQLCHVTKIRVSFQKKGKKKRKTIKGEKRSVSKFVYGWKTGRKQKIPNFHTVINTK